jgi:hypothetical protein
VKLETKHQERNNNDQGEIKQTPNKACKVTTDNKPANQKR